MQHHIQTLVKHFFHKESLQEVTVSQLQQFIDDYPYSAVGQLLLAKKLRDTGAQNFEEQGIKTSLYFHDPAWAAWLLRDEQAPVQDHTVVNVILIFMQSHGRVNLRRLLSGVERADGGKQVNEQHGQYDSGDIYACRHIEQVQQRELRGEEHADDERKGGQHERFAHYLT